MKRTVLTAVIAIGFIGFILLAKLLPSSFSDSSTDVFDGDRAFKDLEFQTSLGPRVIGSEAHEKQVDWMKKELRDAKWEVEVQETDYSGVPIQNVIAKRGEGSPWIILGAHFDSRFWADQDNDPEKRRSPVLGANDGASGVAVLLELARTIPQSLDKQVWIVFFDGEDNGNIPGYDWILGSSAFVDQLSGFPDAVVVVDMIGDSDLNIYKEKNSDPILTQQIWKTAESLDLSQFFIPQEKYSILDDHTPFIEAGIRAVDLIDFDYEYWHTTQDTLDKVSGESLQIVGSTLLKWLTESEE